MSNWDHKSEWRKRGNNFMVTISRHDVKPSELRDADEGLHRWAVYAYIYPKHRLFDSFIPDGEMWQAATSALPLHAAPSLFITHRAGDNKDEVSAFQIGADYSHLYDDEYYRMDDSTFPNSVTHDAEQLFMHLQEASDVKESAA